LFNKNKINAILQSSLLLPIILILAFALRLAVIAIPITQTMDFDWYVGRGAEIAHGRGYNLKGLLTAYWPVGWPAVLAGLFTVTGESVLAAQLLNAALGTLCCWLTAIFGFRVSNSRVVGNLAALLIAVYPNQVAYVPLISTEIFYESLVLVSILMLMSSRNSNFFSLLTGALFGLETLTKTQSLILPIFLLSWMWMVQPNRKTLLRFVKRGILVYIGLVCVVAPWTYRNWTVFHEFVPVSTNGGWTLATGNNPEANGGYNPDTALVQDLRSDFDATREVIRDRIFNDRAIAWIQQNPGRFIALVPQKLFKMWAGDGEAEWSYQRGHANYDSYALLYRAVRLINQIFYFALFCGALPICYLLLRNRVSDVTRWAHTGIALLVYLSLLTIVFSGQSRFHFVLMPFLAVYAAWSWTLWSRSAKPVTSARQDLLSDAVQNYP